MPFLRAVIPILALVLASPAGANDAIDAFLGAYVGSGVAELPDGTTEIRDMDVSVEPYKDDGFTIRWITVIHKGDRTSPDVRRRAVEEDFLPSEDKPGVYILAPRGSVFQKAELPNPLEGEPMRWATINANTLTVYSLGITTEGTSEMQIYHRTLTEKGMDVAFLRLHDEAVELRVAGTLVKTD
ncbi:MAG: hypothetical protein ACE5Q3_13660 [Alphaproteobacteria bacterium]